MPLLGPDTPLNEDLFESFHLAEYRHAEYVQSFLAADILLAPDHLAKILHELRLGGESHPQAHAEKTGECIPQVDDLDWIESCSVLFHEGQLHT